MDPYLAQIIAQLRRPRGVDVSGYPDTLGEPTVSVEFGQPMLERSNVALDIGEPQFLSRTSPEDELDFEDRQRRAVEAMAKALRRKEALKPGDVDVEMGLPQIEERR